MKTEYNYCFFISIILVLCIVILFQRNRACQPHICFLEIHGVTQDNQIFYTKFPMKHNILFHTKKSLHLENDSDGIVSKWTHGGPSRGTVAIEYQGVWYRCVNADIINEKDYIRPYSSGSQAKLIILYNDDFMHIPVFYSGWE